MSKPASPRPVYLSVLGFQSEDELINHVTGEIQTAIRIQRGDIIPVAVSAAAQAFDVRPDPIIGEMPRNGSIQFDALEDKFVIRINQSNGQNTRSGMDGYENRNLPDLSIFYRSRFTYAHEFAHRFFFVPENSRWQRAIDITTQGLKSDARRAAIRNLSNYEESLCNRIAGDVLVPESHLLRILGDSLEDIDGFHLTLRSASHTFKVSQECLLVRIKRAILHLQLHCPPNLCIFVIANSDRKGGEGRSRKELRIQESILPTRVLGVKVKAPFPGLAVRNLGQEAFTTAETAIASASRTSPLPVDLNLNLATSDGTGMIAPRLKGWSSALYSGGGGSAGGLLLWGLLDSV